MSRPLTSRPLRILLVDDHAVVREGYRRLLEREPGFVVSGEADDAAEACAQAARLAPDIVVMDVSLPGASGIEAMRRMLSQRSATRILMFSMYEDAIFCSRALQAGASGYLSKSSAPEALVAAVEAVARGERYVSPDVARKMTRSASDAEVRLDQLTSREFEVLRLLARGETLSDIAAKLGISEKTAANHQSAIRYKLGIRNGVQLAQLAERLGLAGLACSGPGALAPGPRSDG